jgi:hypothetical protein
MNQRFAGLRSRRGSGVGLLLVRTLVELHGGRTEAFSAGRGHGGEFVIRLPAPDLNTRLKFPTKLSHRDRKILGHPGKSTATSTAAISTGPLGGDLALGRHSAPSGLHNRKDSWPGFLRLPPAAVNCTRTSLARRLLSVEGTTAAHRSSNKKLCFGADPGVFHARSR